MKTKAEIEIEIEIELEQIARNIVEKQIYLMAGNIIIDQVDTNDDYYEQYDDLFNVIDIDTTIEINNDTSKTDGLSNEEKLAFIKDKDNDLEIEYQQPSEFWIVSEWLYRNLKEHDEVTTKLDIYYVWGRTNSGQHISSDYVIKQIAKSLYESNIK